MDFSSFDLDPRLLVGIKTQGYTTPTPIQEQAIPPVLAGRDVLGLAQTGTGKTAAFVLPILQRLLTNPGTHARARALVITPTRELAEQIHEQIGVLGQKTRIRSATVYGGVGAQPQIAALRAGVEIIVACPGRLLDHLNQNHVDLSKIEVLVIDEADRMFDMGFLPEVRKILKHLPHKRQTLFFSATMPDEVRLLARDVLGNPLRVQVDSLAPATTVAHAVYPVAQHLKTALLLALLERTSTGSVLIFTRTKHRAKRLGDHLKKAGFQAASLQGNLTQNQRQRALSGFREGKHQILVATDIAARGLDIASISHVINYDIPDTPEAYTHRIGRTGRAAKTGDAFTLITPEDADMVRTIERLLGTKLERRTLPDFDYKQAAPPPQAGSERPARGSRSNRNPRAPQPAPSAPPATPSMPRRPAPTPAPSKPRSAPSGARRRTG